MKSIRHLQSWAHAGQYYLQRSCRIPSKDLESLATKSLEICPKCEIDAITPFYWKAHEERIISAERYTADVVIREHLNRSNIEMTPLHLHRFHDAVLWDGSIFLGKRHRIELRHKLQRKWPSIIPRVPYMDIDRASLTSSCAGTTWFGHWLEDEIPRQLLAQPLANSLVHNCPSYSHEARYRELLDLPVHWRVGSARVRELVFADEFAQNPHKTKRYHELRRRLWIAKPPVSVGHRVFLLRGDSGASRPLVNEEELAAHYHYQGYRCIHVKQASLDELLDACMGASVVVSVEGSNLAHCLYAMLEGGTMIILNPPKRVHTTVADIGVFCGLHAGMFICEPSDVESDGFTADPHELDRFIDETLVVNQANDKRLSDYVQRVIGLCPPPDRSLDL